MDFEKIAALLRENARAAEINWLEAAEISFNEGGLVISFLQPFAHSWFKENALADLERLLNKAHPEIKLETRVNGGKEAAAADEDYFTDFLYNEKNYLALKAAQTLALKTIPESYPPLTLFYGQSGSGKSHLLKAIRQKRLAYGGADGPAAGLLNQPIQDWAREKLPPALVIDDLQSLESQPKALLNLRGLCDRALSGAESGEAPFRLAAAVTAESLSQAPLPDWLLSRFERGLCLSLPPADLDIRLRFAEKFNRKKKLGLSRGFLVNIARQSNRLTDTLGLLHKAEFFISLKGAPPSRRDLDSILSGNALKRPPDWQNILESVAGRLNLRTEDLLGSKRGADYVLGRQIAMYIARARLALSYQEIGRLFGGKDHSTVMHAVKKIERLRQTDGVMHKLLTELEK